MSLRRMLSCCDSALTTASGRRLSAVHSCAPSTSGHCASVCAGESGRAARGDERGSKG